MIRLVQIIPVDGFLLFGQMVKKEREISGKGGAFYRSGAKIKDRAKWSHATYKGWIKLRRAEGEVVTAEVRSLSKGRDEWQLLHAFIGWIDRHFSAHVQAVHIHYRKRED